MPKPHLTARARKHWLSYVRQLADLMGLKDKRFCIGNDPPVIEDATAEIHCIYGSSWSNVRLSQGFLESPPEIQREVIAHELIHAHFAPPDCIAEKEIRPEVYAYWEMCMEYSVDAIASSWCKHLPLPPVMMPR